MDPELLPRRPCRTTGVLPWVLPLQLQESPPQHVPQATLCLLQAHPSQKLHQFLTLPCPSFAVVVAPSAPAVAAPWARAAGRGARRGRGLGRLGAASSPGGGVERRPWVEDPLVPLVPLVPVHKDHMDHRVRMDHPVRMDHKVRLDHKVLDPCPSSLDACARAPDAALEAPCTSSAAGWVGLAEAGPAERQQVRRAASQRTVAGFHRASQDHLAWFDQRSMELLEAASFAPGPQSHTRRQRSAASCSVAGAVDWAASPLTVHHFGRPQSQAPGVGSQADF